MRRFIKNKQLCISCLNDSQYTEEISICSGNETIPILKSAPFATIPSDERPFAVHALDSTVVSQIEERDNSLTVSLEHPEHTVTRKISFSELDDIVDITVTFIAKKSMKLRAVADKWFFLPERRDDDNELSGPLDFVWSQRIKSFPTSVVSHYSFRTPVMMMQQGNAFVSLAAGLEEVTADDLIKAPLGMDLDVTRETLPWMSYGVLVSMPMSPDKPCEAGHSQLVHGSGEEFCTVLLEPGQSVLYRYSLIVSEQPEKLGYRYAVRYLWNRYGKPQMNLPENIPQNCRFENLNTLNQWRAKIWDISAQQDYFTVEKDGVTAGGITGRRQGEWFSKTDYKHDVWFACWLQELVTGYGMYQYGAASGKEQWKKNADQILNFILSAPRTKGMFPVICYCEADGTETWLNDDGWAGFHKEFHTLQMSWTAWLMLIWGKVLFPERMAEIKSFCSSYADFLLCVQHDDGCIPSWFNKEGKPSRKQFRDFNAETAVSALFLMEFGTVTGDEKYLNAGIKSLDFITAFVVPRQRWFDLETFLSCSKKPFNFYDSISTQYPQCNLSEIHAAIAYLRKYQITKKNEDLIKAEQMMDYLLLTQQLWKHPLIHINTFGGFTVQNTDNEWSDVREGLCAILLYQYYLETGKTEYLERSIAARHSGFEVLPYENWAHCGYEGMQYDSSLLWGGGVILTAAEYLENELGTLVIDADAKLGLGIDGCVISDINISENTLYIEADLSLHPAKADFSVRIFDRGERISAVVINGNKIGTFTAEQLKHKLSFRLQG